MSNNVAVDMYKQLGYVIYRRVLEYYSGDPDEDAYGERHFLFLVVCPRPLVLKMCLHTFLYRGNCCPFLVEICGIQYMQLQSNSRYSGNARDVVWCP